MEFLSEAYTNYHRQMQSVFIPIMVRCPFGITQTWPIVTILQCFMEKEKYWNWYSLNTLKNLDHFHTFKVVHFYMFVSCNTFGVAWNVSCLKYANTCMCPLEKYSVSGLSPQSLPRKLVHSVCLGIFCLHDVLIWKNFEFTMCSTTMLTQSKHTRTQYLYVWFWMIHR